MDVMNSSKKVVKKVLSAGRGPLPEFRKLTKAVLHYEAFKPLVDCLIYNFPDSKDDFELVDSTRKPYPRGYGKALEFVFGKQFQVPVIEECLKSMHVDEVSQFDIDVSELYAFPQVAYKLRDIAETESKGDNDGHKSCHHRCALAGLGTGYPELDDLIKQPKSLRFVIHLIEVLQVEDYEPERWQLDKQEKLNSISKLKEKGNEFFRQGDYDKAALQYREALTRLDVVMLEEKPGEPEWIEHDKQNAVFYSNLSQCFLNMKRYYEAFGAAEEVLKREPSNDKALFRRAKAQIAIWKLDEAEEDLDKLIQRNVDLKNVAQREKERIAELRKERQLKDKILYKNMFKPGS